MGKHLQHNARAGGGGGRRASACASSWPSAALIVAASGAAGDPGSVHRKSAAVVAKRAEIQTVARIDQVSAGAIGRRAGRNIHPRQTLSRRRRSARRCLPSSRGNGTARQRAHFRVPLWIAGRRQGACRHRHDRTGHHQACGHDGEGRRRGRPRRRAGADVGSVVRRGHRRHAGRRGAQARSDAGAEDAQGRPRQAGYPHRRRPWRH